MFSGMNMIKRLGALVLGVIIAISAAFTIMPTREVQAAGYEPLIGTGTTVVKDWDFQTGLYQEMPGKIVKIPTGYETTYPFVGQELKGKTVVFGDGLIIKFTQGYKSYDGKLFDIYVKLTAGPSLAPDTEVEFRNNNNGGGTIRYDNGYQISISTGPTNDVTGTDFEYEIWLRYNAESGTAAETATDWNTPPTSTDLNEPFVGGSNFMSGLDVPLTSSPEAARPWSSNGILYANDNDPGSTTHYWSYRTMTFKSVDYSFWVSTSQSHTDSGNKFVIGYGYTPDHTIKGGYTNKVIADRTSGIGEIVLGYRVRKLVFQVAPSDTGYNNPSLKKEDENYLENSYVSRGAKPYSGGTAYMPDDTFGSTTELNPGNVFTYWTAKDDIQLSGGRVISAGQKVTEADMPDILIEGNPEKPDIVFYAHTATDPVELKYHIENDKVPLLPSHSTGTLNLVEKYQKDSDVTSNGSYSVGTTLVGSDGNTYKLMGWFKDDAYTNPFSFGGTLSELYTDIFAKWELVNAPTPTTAPTPTPTPSDTTPAGGPIKVEFVTPLGITPGTQIKNVGDKADDPGIPKDPSTLKPGTVIGGYRFEGWYLDQGYTLPYSFDTKLQHSIVLYAKWVRVSPKTGDGAAPNMLYALALIALTGAGLAIAKAKRNDR